MLDFFKFEAPVVERKMYKIGMGGYDDHDGMVGRQLEIWVGMIIDSSGLSVEPSITGSGTLKSYTPPIRVEDTYDTAKREGGLSVVDNGQGGVGLYWNMGDATTMTIGTQGGEGPTLDLRGGVAGLSLFGNGDVMNNSGKYTNNIAPRAEDDEALSWTAENPSDGEIWAVFGTARQYEEGNYWTPGSGGSSGDEKDPDDGKEDPPGGDTDPVKGGEKLGIDPAAEAGEDGTGGYSDTVIDVQGYTEDEVKYSVDVEWGAMTFYYQKLT